MKRTGIRWHEALLLQKQDSLLLVVQNEHTFSSDLRRSASSRTESKFSLCIVTRPEWKLHTQKGMKQAASRHASLPCFPSWQSAKIRSLLRNPNHEMTEHSKALCDVKKGVQRLANSFACFQDNAKHKRNDLSSPTSYGAHLHHKLLTRGPATTMQITNAAFLQRLISDSQ